MNVFIRIYDCLASRRWLAAALGVLLTALLVAYAVRLEYHEDIFDFLPQDEEYARSMQVYSSLSQASRIVVIFEGGDPDAIVSAIDDFALQYPDAVTEADIDGMMDRLDYIYAHLPYFMTDDSYRLLEEVYNGSTDTLQRIFAANKAMLSMPGTSFLFPAVASDPLHLVPIARGVAGQYAGAQSSFTTYNGYMMSATKSVALPSSSLPMAAPSLLVMRLWLTRLRPLRSLSLRLTSVCLVALWWLSAMLVASSRTPSLQSPFLFF